MNLVHMVIDEAAALGHVAAIDDMLAQGRGYGLRVHLFFQNAAQLMRCYPDGQHHFVLGTTTNIFMAAHDWVTCEEISKRSGSATVVIASGGDGDGDSRQYQPGGGTFGVSRNRNLSWSYAGKPLLRPEQVAALPERVAVIFAPGVGRPLLTLLRRVHEEAAPPSRAERAWAAAAALARPLFLSVVAALGVFTVSTARFEPAGRPVRRPVPRPPQARRSVAAPPTASSPATTPRPEPKASDYGP